MSEAKGLPVGHKGGLLVRETVVQSPCAGDYCPFVWD
jgi:hypothetical protein